MFSYKAWLLARLCAVYPSLLCTNYFISNCLEGSLFYRCIFHIEGNSLQKLGVECFGLPFFSSSQHFDGHPIDPNLDVAATVKHYFHPKYEQCINGVLMNHDDYIAHVLEQRQNIKITYIEYKHIVEVGNEVFALYYPKGINLDKESIEAEVIAYFKFEDQKLFKIHGQVRLIKGALADVDM